MGLSTQAVSVLLGQTPLGSASVMAQCLHGTALFRSSQICERSTQGVQSNMPRARSARAQPSVDRSQDPLWEQL